VGGQGGSIATLATGFFLLTIADSSGVGRRVLIGLPLPLGPARAPPLDLHWGQLLAIRPDCGAGWLNYFGVKAGATCSVAVTTVKVVLIAGIVVAGRASAARTAGRAGFHRGRAAAGLLRCAGAACGL